MRALTALLLYALTPATTSQPIVGGEVVTAGAWPEVAALVYEGGVVGCTGVLVQREWVLTARHCVSQGRLTEVALDTVELEAPGERLGVAAVWAAPEGLDAALVLLEKPAAAWPRRWAVGCAAGEVRDGARATIVGWGATDAEGTQWSTRLRGAEVSVVDASCAQEASGCLSGKELLAGGEGADTCRGDSGGPLSVHTPWGPLLAGLTSRGVQGSEAPCGQGGIYVRLDALRPWVEAMTGRAPREPTCGLNHAPRASAPMLEVVEGEAGQARVAVEDEDAGDWHRFEVLGPGSHGEAWVEEDGTVHYQARGGFTGEDVVRVRVTDDGEPALSTEVAVPVTVRSPGEPGEEPEGGCSAAGGSGRLELLGLLGLWVLTRRKHPQARS